MPVRILVPLLIPLLAGRASGAPALSLQVLSPEGEKPAVVRERVHVAARTEPGATASIGGVPCPVYSTGIFVRDGIPLQPGVNRIKIAVSAPGNRTAEKTLEVRRDAPPVPRSPQREPIAIEADSVRPDKDLALLPGDELEVAFRGSPGRQAEFRGAGMAWQRLAEETDGGAPTGRYRGTVVMAHAAEQPPAAVEVRLSAEKSGEKNASPVAVTARGRLALWSPAVVRQAVVTRDIGTDLVWGLQEVRLGGPAVGRMPQHTVLRVTGQRGNRWRIRLTPQLEAWAEAEHLKLLPPGSPVARLNFPTLQVRSHPDGDRVEIPWDARIPFAVTPTRAPSGRAALEVDLYGAQHGTTWISHHDGLAAVHEVSVEQLATDHVRVRVELIGPRLWGWKTDTSTGALVLTVRGTPRLLAGSASPVSGLTIVVEPGHGGSNEGAAGLTKVLEKDVTLEVADLLATELERQGARVHRIRTRDEFISMEDRAKRALESGGHLFVSIHCNSSGTEGGFLRVGGTSTFYKHSTSRDLARAVVATMLAETGLPEFGSVGNFNYYPIRALTWMPAVLVETAFISNPFEESKLLDPVFQRTMARAVRRGVEDFLRRVATER